ncbi:NTP transferase domain-containing protein [Patescibacteria group bacterium]|nr:NTP transferase domain-containing protein [Patescibacteria group bacterium]
MSNQKHVFGVILAGGGGTRLWPKSRNATPKQFLRLTGKEAMVQVAANRLTKIMPWNQIIVVTNKNYTQEIHNLLPQVPAENVIAEPEKRDTALAMLTGALYAMSKDPEAVVVNGASDHVITDEKEFVKVMEAAVEEAESGQNLVAVGITPTRPETGFGYIKIGDHLRKTKSGLAVFKVDSFTEKPNATTARAFLSTGKYFWNANMYVWSARALQHAFQKYMPEMYELTKELPKLTTPQFHEALPEIYKKATSISIDYAISEKADNLLLIPGDFGWNDVGDWKVVYELAQKDLVGNVTISDNDSVKTLCINSENNLIHTDGRLIGLIGVNDMIIIDTPEILLIVPKERSQEVKKLVERLKEEGKKEYL